MDIGMWMVKSEMKNGRWFTSVVHLNTILQAAHLIPYYGEKPIPRDFSHVYLLDAFGGYFVNRYADRHAHEIVF